jgi:hypothetical protein
VRDGLTAAGASIPMSVTSLLSPLSRRAQRCAATETLGLRRGCFEVQG